MEDDYLNKIHLTSNGFDNLKNNAQLVYGERGNFEHNLKRYYCGDEFNKSGCKIAGKLKDIPTISQKSIKCQIKREEMFKKACKDTIKKFDKLKESNKLNDDVYLELGGIMGICPGQCDWYDTLFPHLIDLFVQSKDEENEILKKVENSKNVISVMVECLTDCLRGGQFIEFGDKRVWSQGYARNYFRGENAYNKVCKPSLFRGMTRKDIDRIKVFIEIVKQCELVLILKELNFIKNWPYFSQIDYTAISQHYGIKTAYLDITSDIKVALFFACCKYDYTTNKWRPLNEDEFKNKSSRKEVYERGGDSRYGIIFTAPVDVCNMAFEVNSPNFQAYPVIPIGFQPFNRCDTQSAYAMAVKNIDFDLFRYPLFKKFKFRHSKKLCEWIFNEMEQGNKIFPNEFSSGIFEIVSKINNANEFSIQSVEMAKRYFKPNLTLKEIICKLKDFGLEVTTNQKLFSKQELSKINDELEEKGISYFENLTKCWRFRFSL